MVRFLSLGLALGALLAGCRRAPSPTDSASAAVVGDWVQVYPRAGALDTLRLLADGRLVGVVPGPEAPEAPRTRWRLGSAYLPGGLCFVTDPAAGQAPGGTCQAYTRRGDTLWLADGVQTTYLRVGAVPPVGAAWDTPPPSQVGFDPLTIGRDSTPGHPR